MRPRRIHSNGEGALGAAAKVARPGKSGSRSAEFGKQVGYGAPGFNNSGCYTETLPATSTDGTAGFDPPRSSNGPASFSTRNHEALANQLVTRYEHSAF